jgi:hypothetical protein
MYWDLDGLVVYVMNSREQDPETGEFVNEWMDYAYEVHKDDEGKPIVDDKNGTGDPAGYLLNSNPTNTPLSTLLKDDVLVFVHGFNVDEKSAIEKWTEKVYGRLVRAGYQGDIVVQSWRGNEPGNKLNYFGKNVKNANKTGKNLAALVKEINDAKPQGTVNLAAHSLGNRVALEGVKYAQENFNHDLKIHNLIHLEAAVDGNVYYEKDRWWQIRGEYANVAWSVDNVVNMTSRRDLVLLFAYGADRNLRRGYLIRPYQPWRRASLGSKSPKNKRRLPANFTSIATRKMGIDDHSAMVDKTYLEVEEFWKRFLVEVKK